MRRITSDVKTVEKKFGHGSVVVDGAGLVDFAVKTFERRRVVVLHVDEGEDVADGTGDGEVGAELSAVARGSRTGSACLQGRG